MEELSLEEQNTILELVKLPPKSLETFLTDIDNQILDSPEKQKHFNLLLKLSLDDCNTKSSETSLSTFLKSIQNDVNCEEQIKLIQDFISSKRILLDDRKRITNMSWRLEAKVSSRLKHDLNNFDVKIISKIHTISNDRPKDINVEISPSVLKHLIQKLELALLHSRTNPGK